MENKIHLNSRGETWSQEEKRLRKEREAQYLAEMEQAEIRGPKDTNNENIKRGLGRPAIFKPSKQLSIYITDELNTALEDLAKSSKRSKRVIIDLALVEFFNRNGVKVSSLKGPNADFMRD